MPGLCDEQGCSSTASLFNFSLFLTYFWCVLPSEFFRGIEPGEYIARNLPRYVSEARRAGWEAGNSQAGAELAVLRENVFPLRKISVLLLRPFT